MILMHSYTYRTYPVEVALRRSIEYGYDGIELWHIGKDNPIDRIKKVFGFAKQYGANISTITFGTDLFIDDTDERRKNIETWKEVIRIGKSCGVKIINGGVGLLVGSDPRNFGANGSAMAKGKHYEMAAGGLREIAEICEGEGIKVTLEIHMNTLHDSAASTLKLLNMVDSLSILANLDPGNMHATPQAEEVIQAIGILKGRIGYFHFKNCRKIDGAYDYSWPLANGDLDNYKIVKALYETDYRGDMCIEYCGLGDPSVPAKEDIVYLRGLIGKVL